MPSQLTYPGVYIEEVPSGIRTIVGVSTSVTAFVGRAPRGRSTSPPSSRAGATGARVGGSGSSVEPSFSVRDLFLNASSRAVIIALVNDTTNDAQRCNSVLGRLGLDSDPALLTLEAISISASGEDGLRGQ